MEEKELKNSFTIGTAATTGCIKIYIDDIHSEQAIKDIDKAIKLWGNSKLITERIKKG